jgi:hypothetical protein
MKNKLPILITFLCFSVIHQAASAENPLAASHETVKRISVTASKPSFQLPGDPKAINFIFDKASEKQGWLKLNGEWHVQGWVTHNHLRCATYSLGMRFGKGEGGCMNVEWLTTPLYVTHKKQCNQTTIHHKGGSITPEIAPLFNEVTCGQLLIKCEGVCN